MKAVYKKHTKARELVYVRGQHLELPDHMTKDEALRPHMLQAPGSASRFVFFFNTRIEHWHGVRNEVDGEPLSIRVCVQSTTLVPTVGVCLISLFYVLQSLLPALQ